MCSGSALAMIGNRACISRRSFRTWCGCRILLRLCANSRRSHDQDRCSARALGDHTDSAAPGNRSSTTMANLVQCQESRVDLQHGRKSGAISSAVGHQRVVHSMACMPPLGVNANILNNLDGTGTPSYVVQNEGEACQRIVHCVKVCKADVDIVERHNAMATTLDDLATQQALETTPPIVSCSILSKEPLWQQCATTSVENAFMLTIDKHLVSRADARLEISELRSATLHCSWCSSSLLMSHVLPPDFGRCSSDIHSAYATRTGNPPQSSRRRCAGSSTSGS